MRLGETRERSEVGSRYCMMELAGGPNFPCRVPYYFMMRSIVLGTVFASMFGSFSTAMAVELTLDQALQLAKERNGTIRAARLNLEAARSAVLQSRSAYLPTVTPIFRYDVNETRQFTGTGFDTSRSGAGLDVTAAWRVIDNGTREFSYQGARASAYAEEASALLTLREKLFDVIQGYYNSLRAQELLKVQQAQFERADLILRQTQARAEVGDIARKDILQAQADQLNARVSVLGAENRVKTTLTALKADIGWSPSEGTVELAEVGDPQLKSVEFSLDNAISDALTRRPDLIATRRQIDAQRYTVRSAEASAGLDFTVDASFTRSFARDVVNRSGLGLFASFPLFDGGRSREEVRQRRLGLEASLVRLEQTERDIRGLVEQAYTTYETNLMRLEAAKLALEAARKNFEAASRSQALGAADLVEVVQAQTSLVTAEVNAVEAIFDALISEAELNLAIGAEMRGE